MMCVEEPTRVQRSLRIPVERIILNGDLTMPRAAKSLVIVAHGSGNSRYRQDSQLLAQRLADIGIASLLLDLLTQEEDAVDQLTQRLRFNIPLLTERLVKTTEWLRRLNGTERLCVGYFGVGGAAAAALAAAATLGNEIGAVVARSGRVDLASNVLPAVKSSTLFVVGEMDDFVRGLNEQAYARLGNEKQFAVVQGATHQFTEPGALEESARLATAWFRKKLPVA